MADVTVEFGAADVGLEKALQQIQAEMTNLQGKVRSGEQTFQELEQTMRRIGQVENMEKRIKSMGNESQEAAGKVNQLETEMRQLEGASTTVNSGTLSFGKMTAAISGAYAALLGFQEGFLFIADSIKQASDLAETMNKVDAIFGEAKDAVIDFSASAVSNLGMTRDEALNAASTFGTFGKAAGLSGDSLSDFSTELVTLSSDFASFYNSSPEAAIEAIGAALRGESEPLRKFGVLLDDAKLKAEAMNLGLYDGTGALDSQTKTLAAFNVIMKESNDAQGDFERTSDSLSNQLKILKANYEELQTALGDGLIAPTKEFVGILNNDLIPTLRGTVQAGKDVIEFFKSTPDSSTAAGKAVNVVAESLNGMNYYLNEALKFITPMDDLMLMLKNKGQEAAGGQNTAAQALDRVGDAASGAAPELTAAALQAAAAAGEFSGLAEKADETAPKVASAFSLSSDFAPSIESAATAWGTLNDTITGTTPLLESNLTLTDSLRGTTDEQAQSLGGINEQLTTSDTLLKLIDETYGSQAVKLAEMQAKEETRKEKLREALDFELQINQAKASGDAELVKTLENQKLFNTELQKAIDSGMGEPEARAFALQMVNAKNAAASVYVDSSSIQAAKKEAQDAAAASESFAKWLDYIKGQETPQGIRGLASDAKAARQEIEAFGEYAGVDLKNKSFPDIARELGVYEVGKTGTQQIDSILEYVEQQRQSMLVSPIDEQGGKAALKNIETEIKNLGATPQTITLDASNSIEQIKRDLTQEIDLALSSSKGSAYLAEIRGFVESIKDLVGKIEPKLPTHALA